MSLNTSVKSEKELESFGEPMEIEEPEPLDNPESCGYCGDIHARNLTPNIFERNRTTKFQFNDSSDVPFGNGEWLPVIPEPEEELYWWSFPWETNYLGKKCPLDHEVYPFAVWKLIAGTRVTHLPEQCLDFFTPTLACQLFHEPKTAPYVVYFDPMYEDVLEVFTARMLGLAEDVSTEKLGLLNKLFDETGYIHKNDNARP